MTFTNRRPKRIARWPLEEVMAIDGFIDLVADPAAGVLACLALLEERFSSYNY